MEIIVPQWPAPENIKAFSSCRSDGLSSAEFSSLNLALHVNDDEQLVEKNRQRLISEQAIPNNPVWLNQTHSNKVVELSSIDPASKPISADAAIASLPKQVCTVMTADCLPLLFCNSSGSGVAAVHAGWRGLLNGIIENTINALSKPEQLMVWLGPAIGPGEFEVGIEVKAAFIAKNSVFQQAFRLRPNGKYLADIYLLARMILVQQGVTKIYGGEHCTVTENGQFYSYRRDGQTGRMASFIWLE